MNAEDNFECWIVEVWSELARTLSRLPRLFPPSEQDDVTDAAMLEAVEAVMKKGRSHWARQDDPRAAMARYMRKVAINVVKRHSRNAIRRNDQLNRQFFHGDHSIDEPTPLEHQCSLEEDQADLEALHEAMEQLSDTHRRIIIMRYWDDMSQKDIAEASGQTISAVNSQLCRIRHQLRQTVSREMRASQ